MAIFLQTNIYGMIFFSLHLQDVVTQPIGLVHYPGVAEGLYVACSSGTTSLPNQEWAY